jgi:hypothetical protein
MHRDIEIFNVLMMTAVSLHHQTPRNLDTLNASRDCARKIRLEGQVIIEVEHICYVAI